MNLALALCFKWMKGMERLFDEADHSHDIESFERRIICMTKIILDTDIGTNADDAVAYLSL